MEIHLILFGNLFSDHFMPCLQKTYEMLLRHRKNYDLFLYNWKLLKGEETKTVAFVTSVLPRENPFQQ